LSIETDLSTVGLTNGQSSPVDQHGQSASCWRIVRQQPLDSPAFSGYLTLLEATFLIARVPAWTANLRKRLLKTPKVVMVDPGLAAHLQNVDARRLKSEPALLGPLLETVVVTELLKQQTWSSTQPEVGHFRTAHGEEVDVVLDARGRLVGVEVKAAVSISADDFRGLRAMAAATGRRFHRGILFYLGETAVTVGPRLYALPLPALWRT
jgi:predicted AAA+ superfamily ATPase